VSDERRSQPGWIGRAPARVIFERRLTLGGRKRPADDDSPILARVGGSVITTCDLAVPGGVWKKFDASTSATSGSMLRAEMTAQELARDAPGTTE